MRGIYGIKNLVDDKIYVGSSEDIKKRWNQHKYNLKKNIHINTHLQNAWNLYGAKSFKFEVLEEVDSLDLYIAENKWMDELNTLDMKFGYNMQTAQAGVQWTEETREKLSKSLKGNQARLGSTQSEETKRKLSELNKGKKITQEHFEKLQEASRNKVITDETRRKISEAAKKRERKPLSEEHKRKLSEAAKGRKLSEESKKKLSESAKKRGISEKTREACTKANTGRKMSEETRRKMSEAQKRRNAKLRGETL